MYKIKFRYNNSDVEFTDNIVRSLYVKLVTWLHNNGYRFSGSIHEPFIRKPHTSSEVRRSQYKNDFIQVGNSDIYLYRCGNITKLYPNMILMLKNFGIDESTIKTEGFESLKSKSTKIKKFQSFAEPEDSEDVQSDDELSSEYVPNPFGGEEDSSALCILGKSGAGKSHTTEQSLRDMEHEYRMIIPSSTEANSFIDYSGDKFDISTLGELIMKAQNDPDNFYTAVYDECHRSLSIKRIEEDLLQAISRKRNIGGKRYFTLSRAFKKFYTEPSEEFPTPLEEEYGKIFIPDNFGFVFLSSNANNITRNPDFFNRVEIAIFTKDNQEDDLTELETEPKNPEAIRNKFNSAEDHGNLQ